MNKMLADRYMLVTSLGQGGMADVYLGIDTILNREVAIKILRGALANDPVTLLRFQREANAASKLSHPNVVEVYDVGESENRHYIVMEYVRGRTLKQLINQRGALHKEEAVEIMIQLTSAVQHAHENNIIHRDIKPQNVLILEDGRIKITDFGIALAHDAVQLTQSDAVLGSAHYLAPETTRGEPATNQIDIYALGIVFYELLVGDVPFHGESPVSIAMKHLREEVPSVREFNPTLPQSIENIIIKATAKNKSLRYKTAKIMLEDLNLCLLPEYSNVPKLVFPVENGEPTRVVEHRDMERVTQVNQNNINSKKAENNSKKTIIGILLGVIGILGIVVLLYFSGIISGFSPNKSLTIPDVSNMSVIEAKNTLEELGLKVSSDNEKELHHSIKNGKVIGVNPAIGKEIKEGSEVSLIVSRGLFYTIQDYTGKNVDEVSKMFESKGLKIQIDKTDIASSSKPYGTILKQTLLDKGDDIDPDKWVTIGFEVAAYPEFVVSGIKGKTLKEAKDILTKQGAKVITEQKFSEEEVPENQKGLVIGSNPEEQSYYIQKEDNVITLYYY
ncbi:MAG: Stk1 family PASTA domain-containing Ser/Thr kinase [Erysipelotrichaceae bacterium]